MPLKVRHRSRLRQKEAAALVERLAAEFGIEPPADLGPLDEAEAGPHQVVLRDDEAIALRIGEDVAPTVRGLLSSHPTRRAVTVDMGAVRFIYNGADVMAPGIVEADPSIEVGDIVWVRDEKHRRPLAVGRALMDGPTMAREEQGKAIETLHHVGDELWHLGEEAP